MCIVRLISARRSRRRHPGASRRGGPVARAASTRRTLPLGLGREPFLGLLRAMRTFRRQHAGVDAAGQRRTRFADPPVEGGRALARGVTDLHREVARVEGRSSRRPSRDRGYTATACRKAKKRTDPALLAELRAASGFRCAGRSSSRWIQTSGASSTRTRSCRRPRTVRRRAMALPPGGKARAERAPP